MERSDLFDIFNMALHSSGAPVVPSELRLKAQFRLPFLYTVPIVSVAVKLTKYKEQHKNTTPD